MLKLLSCFKVSIAVDNSDTLAWCVAKLKSVKGGFGVVDYSIGEAVKTDIVPLERIRPVNKKYQICYNALHSFICFCLLLIGFEQT